jgi:hypothetical protein
MAPHDGAIRTVGVPTARCNETGAPPRPDVLDLMLAGVSRELPTAPRTVMRLTT